MENMDFVEDDMDLSTKGNLLVENNNFFVVENNLLFWYIVVNHYVVNGGFGPNPYVSPLFLAF